MNGEAEEVVCSRGITLVDLERCNDNYDDITLVLLNLYTFEFV